MLCKTLSIQPGTSPLRHSCPRLLIRASSWPAAQAPTEAEHPSPVIPLPGPQHRLWAVAASLCRVSPRPEAAGLQRWGSSPSRACSVPGARHACSLPSLGPRLWHRVKLDAGSIFQTTYQLKLADYKQHFLDEKWKTEGAPWSQGRDSFRTLLKVDFYRTRM